MKYFNPRPRAGGDVRHSQSASHLHDFNPRPAQGATRGHYDGNQSAGFQSTPPRRGRRGFLICCSPRPVFQSTPPRRGRRCASSKDCSASYFNPRPRAGGDAPAILPPVSEEISIHAPAQGATTAWTCGNATIVFQSTPPRRGRRAGKPVLLELWQFQSTPPRRGRRRSRARISYCEISIHAPAQGATRLSD